MTATRFFATTTLLASLFVTTTGHYLLAQDVDDEEVLLQPEAVEAALKAGDYKYVALPPPPLGKIRWNGQAPAFRIRFGEPATLAYISGQGLTLTTRLEGSKMSLERVNIWNRKNRFARAYLTPDAHPVVVATLPIPLVSRGALAEFFQVYSGTLNAFAKFSGTKTQAVMPTLNMSNVLGISGEPVVVHPPKAPPRAPGAPVIVGPGTEPPLPGIKITEVADGSIAQKAGLKPNDVIIAVTLEDAEPTDWNPNTPDIPSLKRLLDQSKGFVWTMVARNGSYKNIDAVRVNLK